MLTELILENFQYIMHGLVYYAVGYFIAYHFLKRKSVKLLNASHKEEEELLDLLLEKVKTVSIEKHDDIYYWFDSRTQNFLAQGRNIQDSIEHLKSRFPTEIFLAKLNGVVYQISAPDWVPRKTLEVIDK